MPAMSRVHILGASGSGTTTLGIALADRLGVPHVDADALFWLPTEPPFTTRRSAENRLALLPQVLPVAGQWVFSGSAIKWAMPVEPYYHLIVFLRLDPVERLERLRRREVLRYGARIGVGGDMTDASDAFLDWAASYDTAGLEQRSLAAHEAWLAAQFAAVLRLNAARPLEELIADVMSRLP
jgi:adenylate kinase family enzyme